MYFKAIRVEQAHLESVVLDRILNAWLAEALLIEGYLPEFEVTADIAHTWFFDGHEHVDPLKESSAQALRLANHTTTCRMNTPDVVSIGRPSCGSGAKELSLMNDWADDARSHEHNPQRNPPEEDKDAEPDSPPRKKIEANSPPDSCA